MSEEQSDLPGPSNVDTDKLEVTYNPSRPESSFSPLSNSSQAPLILSGTDNQTDNLYTDSPRLSKSSPGYGVCLETHFRTSTRLACCLCGVLLFALVVYVGIFFYFFSSRSSYPITTYAPIAPMAPAAPYCRRRVQEILDRIRTCPRPRHEWRNASLSQKCPLPRAALDCDQAVYTDSSTDVDRALITPEGLLHYTQCRVLLFALVFGEFKSVILEVANHIAGRENRVTPECEGTLRDSGTQRKEPKRAWWSPKKKSSPKVDSSPMKVDASPLRVDSYPAK
ncbi:hypothetical protein PRIPAC_75257 [Pristionchus pacificus]|uniref:Uncharacterized protein n=1 Tax=Pristionchus pacificus TaxID=54126 RepID=A0A2A6C6M5_PRIPA|nr:hypothetical protein PRIPAC_75257 [Pristionchus pacificus]|eukprot:PDM73767.1 hypothetical protein PRIPAC_41123 [Pristionchus pacificus]